jgi:hypothetical protein
MVARVRPDQHLVVTLAIDGEPPISVHVNTAVEAMTQALVLIAQQGALHAGDALRVRRGEDDDPGGM